MHRMILPAATPAITLVVLNSGRFPKSSNAPTGGGFSEWFEWSELHAPVVFFIGGPKDIQTGHQNYTEITSLPVFLADLPVAIPEPILVPICGGSKQSSDGWIGSSKRTKQQAQCFSAPSAGCALIPIGL